MLDRFIEKRFGFHKTEENEHAAVYERIDPYYGYTQVVCIHKKADGRHLIQSYDKHLMDAKMIGNVGVGLQIKEIIPFYLKARWMIGKYHWNRRDKHARRKKAHCAE